MSELGEGVTLMKRSEGINLESKDYMIIIASQWLTDAMVSPHIVTRSGETRGELQLHNFVDKDGKQHEVVMSSSFQNIASMLEAFLQLAGGCLCCLLCFMPTLTSRFQYLCDAITVYVSLLGHNGLLRKGFD